MTLFERHIGRPIKPNEGRREQEFYLSLIFSKKEMEEWRERFPVRKQRYEQLRLF